MEQLEVEGVITKDQTKIKESVQKFYQDLYWRPDLRLLNEPRITDEEHVRLQRPFEGEEILECLNQCAKEKAPGPDGYPMVFFQTFWALLMEDIIKTAQFFHSNHAFKKSFNATFALIPKKPGASNWKDFRPISLVRAVYKIIAMLLAERLEKVV